jgi:hypothetical protein
MSGLSFRKRTLTPNVDVTFLINQMLLNRKTQTNPNTIAVGDINALFSPIVTLLRLKIQKENLKIKWLQRSIKWS